MKVAETTPKKLVIHMLKNLSEDLSFNDIHYHIHVLERIQIGIQQSESGEGVPHEDVMKKFKKKIEEMKQKKTEKKEIKLVKFLLDCGLETEQDGRCVWRIMSKNEVEVNGIPLQNGSQRMLGHWIAAVCGGGYMDYYCSDAKDEDVEIAWEIMERNGARIVREY